MSGIQPDPSITSIYFDNPAFNLYSKKVDHGEATSLRMRWYGQLKDKPEIFFEKKTVSEDDVSHDDRFKTKEKYVQRFIEGEYKMEKQIEKLSNTAGADSVEAKHFKESVGQIQEFIKSNDLQPVLRANYTRTAFQVPGDDRIRISLDTDLAFIREDAIDSGRPCRDPESWHRTDIDNNELSYPFSSVRKGEVSRFPSLCWRSRCAPRTASALSGCKTLCTLTLLKMHHASASSCTVLPSSSTYYICNTIYTPDATAEYI